MAICLLWPICVSAASAETGTQLTILVRDADGKPVAGAPVQEVGLARERIRNRLVGRTDQSGRLAVSFVPEPIEGTDGPTGYGVYRYVVMPADAPWLLSDVYCWEDASRIDACEACRTRQAEAKRRDQLSNWALGALIALKPGRDVVWDASLGPATPAVFNVIDLVGQPIPGVDLAVGLDLEPDTHTGAGALIPVAQVTTDANGTFTLPNVGDFVYTFDSVRCGKVYVPDQPVRTGALRWAPLTSGTTLRYKRERGIAVTLTVLDAATRQPIEGAEVCQRIRFPNAVQGGVLGKTDQQGMLHFYSADEADADHPMLWTEHVADNMIVKTGYTTLRFSIDDLTGKPAVTFLLDSSSVAN